VSPTRSMIDALALDGIVEIAMSDSNGLRF
jgi:hypothetical protein